MNIKLRNDLSRDITIPFETDSGTIYMDDEHIQACEFLETTDDGWVWAKCPDYGVGQFMSIDLDFDGES